MGNWNARELIRNRMKSDKKFDKRRRSIMYDTDGFNEHQNETIRICKECGGTLKIDSTSDIGQHILAVHVPRKACKACREQGFEWYDSASETSYDMIILQNRVDDTYQVRKKP
jgi:hypothetical protein